MGVVTRDKNGAQFRCQCFFFVAAIQNSRAVYNLSGEPTCLKAFLSPNYLPLQREDLNGPSFNPIPALVVKLWFR